MFSIIYNLRIGFRMLYLWSSTPPVAVLALITAVVVQVRADLVANVRVARRLGRTALCDTLPILPPAYVYNNIVNRWQSALLYNIMYVCAHICVTLNLSMLHCWSLSITKWFDDTVNFRLLVPSQKNKEANWTIKFTVLSDVLV